MPLPAGIWSLFAALVSLARELLRKRAKPPRPSPRQQAALDVHAARAASAAGDVVAVNAQAEQHRVDRALGDALRLVLLALLVSGCGCATIKRLVAPTEAPAPAPVPAVVVISADRYQYPMTNHLGVVGWFVPQAVHAEYCEALALLNYYRDREHTK